MKLFLLLFGKLHAASFLCLGALDNTKCKPVIAGSTFFPEQLFRLKQENKSLVGNHNSSAKAGLDWDEPCLAIFSLSSPFLKLNF